MILITGPTGFIGSTVIKKLITINHPIRLLLRPKKDSPDLVFGIPLDIAVSPLDDIRGLRAAMKNIEMIFHFASAEQEWPEKDLETIDVTGIENLIFAALEAGVKKILYFSRVGADKNSSFPVMRTKSLCETRIIHSGMDFTILRLTDVFGVNDNFTNTIAKSIRYAPGFYPLPGGGKTLLQPLWIEDLLSIILLIMEKDIFHNQIYEIGGGEFLTFSSITKIIMEKIHKKKQLVPVSSAYLRIINLWIKPYQQAFPLSTLWLDLLAINRICSLDSITRHFDLLPVRFPVHLDHI